MSLGVSPSHCARPPARSDTWRDSFRVFLLCLAVVAVVLPAGEVALVVAEGAPCAPSACLRPNTRQPAGDAGHLCVAEAMRDHNALQGGPDDDDFRPSPDRACDADGQGGWPTSALGAGAPGAFCPPSHVRLDAGGSGTVVTFLRGRPALDSSVQFLC